ncbi:MAG: class C beta-lactamase-related serine hydrolase [Deltaproteobacteria bacterium]|nr:MAG: class C beta-lactamase-related serine hydrolase [Deltaproteobacteria bacterium]
MKRFKTVLLSLTMGVFLSACGLAPEDMDAAKSLNKDQRSLTYRVKTNISLGDTQLGVNSGTQYVLNVDSFQNRMLTAFGKTKGYQYVLIRNRMLVAERAGGYAKREWKNQNNILDGYHQTNMTTSTYANVGSVAKFPAAVALLAAIHNKGYSISFLDQKIWTYLPAPWRSAMHSSIKWITFRDLISHHSGITDNGPKDVVEHLKAGVSKVISTGDGIIVNCPAAMSQLGSLQHSGYCYGVREYANANFRLLGYLIASFYDTNLRNSLSNYSATDVRIQNKLGERFEQLMGQLVFSKVTPSITPSCDPANEFPFYRKSYALMYTDRWDMKPGHTNSTKDDLQALGLSRHCRGQGGWYYSARAMALLLGTLGSTNNIIPTNWYRDMMDPTHNQASSDERFGWAGASNVKNTEYENKFGWLYIPNHNGSHPSTASDGRKTYARAIIMKLPMGYHAVAIVNSDGMSTSEMLQKLRDAFIQSVSLQ